jgi:hypothetical protein
VRVKESAVDLRGGETRILTLADANILADDGTVAEDADILEDYSLARESEIERTKRCAPSH